MNEQVCQTPTSSSEEMKERSQKTAEYFEKRKTFFIEQDADSIKKMLMACNNEAFERACRVKLRNPAGMRLLSFILGTYGIDRFLIGDIGMGFLKLFTCGGVLVFWLMDIVCIKKQTKYFNAIKVLNAIAPGCVKKPSLLSRINMNDVITLKKSLQDLHKTL